ncbi:MAG TPA: hypothetical protein VGC41_13825, partial [Kofleriaceae bacterium]
MNVSLERIKDAVMALEEPAWVEGTTQPFSISIAGEAAPAHPARWLAERSEPAPFGHRQETKLDEKVRSTLRVKARGNAKVSLDLAPILYRVESGLSASAYLEATLLDVLVYPTGGRFLRHKDTPRTPQQLGTLIVEVPCAHEGGVMTLDDHQAQLEVDWSTPAAQPRWIALFGDVDHEIGAVTSGHRITVVYTLALTDRPRTDLTLAAKKATLHDAIIAYEPDPQTVPMLFVACTRMVNAPAHGEMTIDVLRGVDRTIAEAFVECGFPISVREVLITGGDDNAGIPTGFWSVYPLKKPIPPELLAVSQLSFEDDA